VAIKGHDDPAERLVPDKLWELARRCFLALSGIHMAADLARSRIGSGATCGASMQQAP
jgi:hypothetical protein